MKLYIPFVPKDGYLTETLNYVDVEQTRKSSAILWSELVALDPTGMVMKLQEASKLVLNGNGLEH